MPILKKISLFRKVGRYCQLACQSMNTVLLLGYYSHPSCRYGGVNGCGQKQPLCLSLAHEEEES